MARDGQRLERLQDGLRFFAPEREVLVFPAWDCLPYDRLSPHPDIVAERLRDAGAARHAEEAGRAGAHHPRLGRGRAAEGAAAQPLCRGGHGAAQGPDASMSPALTKYLGENGYGRADTVMEPGEFAIRGGLVDLFPPGTTEPLRLDLFGDVLEIDPLVRSDEPAHHRRARRGRAAAGQRGAADARRASSASASAIASCSAMSRATTSSTRRCRPASAMSAWSTGCRCSTSGSRR